VVVPVPLPLFFRLPFASYDQVDTWLLAGFQEGEKVVPLFQPDLALTLVATKSSPPLVARGLLDGLPRYRID
jgi:hypothetical protein